MSNLDFERYLSAIASVEAMKCEYLFVNIQSCASAAVLLRREREALQHYKLLGGDPTEFYRWYCGMSTKGSVRAAS